jgi:hypothetical protein
MIEAKDLEAGSCFKGDEPCYSVRGHVDRAEMLAAVQAYEQQQCGISPDDSAFTLDDVYHVWATGPGPKPGDEDEGSMWYLWDCEQKPGSYALTVVYP